MIPLWRNKETGELTEPPARYARAGASLSDIDLGIDGRSTKEEVSGRLAFVTDRVVNFLAKNYNNKPVDVIAEKYIAKTLKDLSDFAYSVYLNRESVVRECGSKIATLKKLTGLLGGDKEYGIRDALEFLGISKYKLRKLVVDGLPLRRYRRGRGFVYKFCDLVLFKDELDHYGRNYDGNKQQGQVAQSKHGGSHSCPYRLLHREDGRKAVGGSGRG
jgi:hypothetical protein